MIQLVKPLRSGQITIPASFREELGIDSDTFLRISLVEGELRIKPVKITVSSARDTAWFKRLYDQFSDVRKEANAGSEKRINQAIDRAVQAARKSHAKSSY